MRIVPLSRLQPGMTIELTEGQALFDVTQPGLPRLGSGARLVVVSIRPLATGSTTRQPYDLVLRAANGSEIPLETDDGDLLVAVIDPEP